jgi:hypothetical protein
MQKVNINDLPEGFTFGASDKGLNILTVPGGRMILSLKRRFTLASYGNDAGIVFPYYQRHPTIGPLSCVFDVEDNEVWVPTPEEVVFSDNPRYKELMKEHGIDPYSPREKMKASEIIAEALEALPGCELQVLDNAIARFQRDKIVLEYHRTTQAWKAFREEMVHDLEGDTFIAVTLKEQGSSTATMEMAEYAKRIRRDAEIRLKEIGQQ